MIKREIKQITSKSATWEVAIPKKAKRGRAIAAYDEFGNSLIWEGEAIFKDGKISITFGFDEHIGVLDYEYEIEGDSDPIVVEGKNGGTVSVVVNQYNYDPQSL